MRSTSLATLTVAVLLALAPAAGAADYDVGPQVLASPAVSPFDPCADQAENLPDQENFEGTEVEPLVAVNPTDQDNVIGVFQEDRWSDGGAHGLLAAVSHDGAATWAHSWAEFSSCSDKPETTFREPLPRATDPWVSFDAGGRAYQVGLPIIDGTLGESAITTSYSDDGGMTWSDPVDVARQTPQNDPFGLAFNDKQSITADPYNADRAWVTWIRGELPGENISFNKLVHAFSYRGQPVVSRTTDGGDTWTRPKAMTNANLYAQGNQIVVLPNGDLLDTQAILFKGAGIQPNLNGVYMAVMRSKDNGAHWSAPSEIAKLRTALSEAVDGELLRVGDYLPDIEVDRSNGDVYITWADGLGTAVNKIVMSKSTDGGRHWSQPQVVSHHNAAQSFNHAVAVGNDGTLALLYYDIDRDTDAEGIPTDVYIRHSHDGGQTLEHAAEDRGVRLRQRAVRARLLHRRLPGAGRDRRLGPGRLLRGGRRRGEDGERPLDAAAPPVGPKVAATHHRSVCVRGVMVALLTALLAVPASASAQEVAQDISIAGSVVSADGDRERTVRFTVTNNGPGAFDGGTIHAWTLVQSVTAGHDHRVHVAELRGARLRRSLRPRRPPGAGRVTFRRHQGPLHVRQLRERPTHRDRAIRRRHGRPVRVRPQPGQRPGGGRPRDHAGAAEHEGGVGAQPDRAARGSGTALGDRHEHRRDDADGHQHQRYALRRLRADRPAELPPLSVETVGFICTARVPTKHVKGEKPLRSTITVTARAGDQTLTRSKTMTSYLAEKNRRCGTLMIDGKRYTARSSIPDLACRAARRRLRRCAALGRAPKGFKCTQTDTLVHVFRKHALVPMRVFAFLSP